MQINVIYYCQILFPLDFKDIHNHHHITITDLINKVSGTRKYYQIEDGKRSRNTNINPELVRTISSIFVFVHN